VYQEKPGLIKTTKKSGEDILDRFLVFWGVRSDGRFKMSMFDVVVKCTVKLLDSTVE